MDLEKAKPSRVEALIIERPDVFGAGPHDTPDATIAVVIVHYETWSACLSCVESVVAQASPQTTVIVVDNDSSSPPPEKLLSLAPSVVLERNRTNVGFAAAANQGMLEAQRHGAEYVWFLNPDTRVLPGSQDALVRTAQRDRSIGAVGSVLLEEGTGRHVPVWGGGHVSSLTGLPHHLSRPDVARMDYVCGASLLVTARALESVGGFDERFFLYWEDTDLGFRLRERGWRLAVADSSRVMHRRSLSAGFQSPLYDRHFTRSTVLFFKKHVRFWPLPVLISCCGRFARRLARGRTANARAVWKGAMDGLAMAKGLDP